MKSSNTYQLLQVSIPWVYYQEWDGGVLSLTEPHNKDKRWDILLHQYRFPLYCVKLHIKRLKRVSKAYLYVVQYLTWSGVYLRSTLSNCLIQKVMTLVTLTSTKTEAYFSTMTTFLHEESQTRELSRGECFRFLCWNIGRFLAPWDCWCL